MQIRWQTKSVGIVIALFCLLLVTAGSLIAAEFRGNDQVVIAEGEVIEDDLYIGANTIIVNGTIQGDLFYGATAVIINGTVNGDLMGGGQSVVINGTVTDDVRIGGTSLTLGETGEIGDDLMMGGFSFDCFAARCQKYRCH